MRAAGQGAAAGYRDRCDEVLCLDIKLHVAEVCARHPGIEHSAPAPRAQVQHRDGFFRALDGSRYANDVGVLSLVAIETEISQAGRCVRKNPGVDPEAHLAGFLSHILDGALVTKIPDLGRCGAGKQQKQSESQSHEFS